MKRGLAEIAILAAMAGCLPGQPVVFKLQIPEFEDKVFDADVIQVPGRNPDFLLLRLLNPVAADVDYGKIRTKLNGAGAGYITAVSSSADGKVARMDLKLREGMHLVPGTNTVEIEATNRHGRRFYRNFLIKTREDMHNGYFAYEVKRAPGDKTGGPEVTILRPDLPVVLAATESSKRLTINGKVTSVNPLATLRVGAKEFQPNQTIYDFEQEVQLSPVDNKIVVEAVDLAGNRMAVTIPVNRAGAGRPLKIEGQRYALIIGISQYSGKPALPSLPSASVDARDFADALTRQAGFKKEDVYVLTDVDATHAQIRNALRNFTSRPGPDDLLIVFFAGYGLHDPLDPSKIYLVAQDTQLGHVSETAISVDDLKSVLGLSIRSRQALLLFDVNHPTAGDWATGNNNLINNYLLRLFPDDPAKAVMVGSSVGEYAMEQKGGGGLFARNLIESARGMADSDQDGVITIREWFLHVSRAVRGVSAGAQNPRFTLQLAEKPLFATAR